MWESRDPLLELWDHLKANEARNFKFGTYVYGSEY